MAQGRRGVDPALVVVLAGVSAALHVGKLPPALPILHDALGLTLVEAGFLLSIVQLAGMALGLAMGLAADGVGLRRSMTSGLAALGVASILGGLAQEATGLLASRVLEGAGLLLTVTPAPSLIRRLMAGRDTDAMLGLWGTYMPFGVAAALLAGPWLLQAIGWRAWWWLLAALSLAMAAWLRAAVPADVKPASMPFSWTDRLRRTLAAPGPWLLALTFAVYSSQWLAVIGFLPSIYAQAGVSSAASGALTALAAAANIVGNFASGRLLQRGVRAQTLLRCGFAIMAFGAAMAFMPWQGAGPLARYAAVLAFSMVGGIVPGTLFALSVRLAPGTDTVSTTVGWMQQWSAFGQFLGPPLVAWIANRVGDWHLTWVMSAACSAAGIVLSGRIAVLLAVSRPPD